MMPQRKKQALVKVTLNLTPSTYERFKELYPRVGASVAIRKLCDAHIAQVDGKIAAKTDVKVNIDLGDVE